MSAGHIWREYRDVYGEKAMRKAKARWYQNNRSSPGSMEEVEDRMKVVLNDSR